MTCADRVRIAEPVVAAIAAHAQREQPFECCGLLLGTSDRVSQAWPATNLDHSPARFLIDPRDHFAALKAARAAGLRVVGAYHSHPSGPSVPSRTDLEEANDPELLHIIVSPGPRESVPAIRAFRLDQGNFHEVTLVPEP
jgi:[CysO sulfur-carrier protein]-S-L-cysteine hydrolase